MNEDQILEAALAGQSFASLFGFTPISASHEGRIRQWLASHDRKFTATMAAGSAELEIQILDVIGEFFFFEGITAKAIKAKLDANPNAKTIRVLIDSPGGDAFMGIAIQAILKRHPAEVTVEVIGEASSAASIAAMSGDKITMHEGSMMMIHPASGGRWGNAKDLRAAADALDGITTSAVDLYTRRTGRDRGKVQAMVDAETWMTAPIAVENGFADSVIPGKAPAKQAKETKADPPAPKAKQASPLFTIPERAALRAHPLNR